MLWFAQAAALGRVAAVIAATVVFPLLVSGPAVAQQTPGYPSRPITLIVPFAKGGPTDVVARLISAEMTKSLRQPVVVENVTGAGGTIGTLRAAQALPDGYTLVLGHMGTHAAAVALYPKLGYRPDVDFAPVALVARMPVLLLARRGFPASNLAEFLAYIRGHQDRINVAHAGIGSVSYASCMLLNHLLDINPTGVPFNGTGPAMDALVAGQVDYMCDQIVNAVLPLRTEVIKAYAIASADRDPAVPEVPTAAEAGLPQFQVEAWNAVFAPKNTATEIVHILNAAVVHALDQPEVRAPMTGLGGVIPPPDQRTPGALAALVAAELPKWRQMLKRPLP
ncbi:tripartite tricarboxylate transporter substrate binding protein BugD [Rhodopseudomonas sp. HC1]|uniref:tripartite tricarboxylate transporter substrate-binding protein n=1 Tax=Rhodopseudomonas infernalis TaxID=2897386 RepID=UPI001EE8D83A|nr:tripartite tricarboxylate transporter substrate-binding protein [Rhodopseudomonas infernalis]MCG6206863.1 tripartite tricarboxylate transporter substrate binding protein BugD [Rhodopseudomonas infernalis]